MRKEDNSEGQIDDWRDDMLVKLADNQEKNLNKLNNYTFKDYVKNRGKVKIDYDED